MTNAILIETITAVVNAARLRRRSAVRRIRQRELSKAVHVRQFAHTERELTKALDPIFKDQTNSIADGLADLVKSIKGAEDQARILMEQVFNPDEWNAKIVDKALPILAHAMTEAAVAFLKPLGVDFTKSKSIAPVRMHRCPGCGEVIHGRLNKGLKLVCNCGHLNYKSTTATRWLAENPGDWDELLEVVAAEGLPIGLMTEIPPWMQASITEQLDASFSQPYWAKVSQTTAGDAERFLRTGLAEGQSIRQMSVGLREHFAEGGFRYARARAENIARTESGNALNGARDAALTGLKDELGEAGQFLMKSWLSVLGNTTRATHADLDGVPADGDGLWNLSGTMIPWPAHWSLPVGERANCQCTIDTEFGMQEDEARQAIEEYNARVEEREPAEREPVPEPSLTFAEQMGKWTQSLTDSELDAISQYTGGEYFDMRDCLNSGDNCTDAIRKLNEDLLTALKRAPSSEDTVYRGIRLENIQEVYGVLAQAKTNGQLIDKGFLSTSSSIDMARGFAGRDDPSAALLLKIKSKRGVRVSHLSQSPTEAETILLPNARLKYVDSFLDEDSGMLILELEEIL